MATSSERSPPPFPDSEDQELESEEVGTQEDSDEGDDMFLSATEPHADDARSPDASSRADPKPQPVSAAKLDLLEAPSQTESKLIDFVEVSSDEIKAQMNTTTAEIAVAATPKMINELQSEHSDDFVDLSDEEDLGESVAPESAVSGQAEKAKDFVDLSDDDLEDPITSGALRGAVPGGPKEEVTREPLTQGIIGLSDDEEDPAESANHRPEATEVPIETPQVVTKLPGDIADPLIGIGLPPAAVNDKPGNKGKPTVSDAKQEPVKSILDPLADILDVTQPSEVTGPTVTKTSLPASVAKTSLPASAAKTSLPASVTKTSLPASVTKTSLPPADLFDEEPGDLFGDLGQTVKAAVGSMFHGEDEDLFSEPLGATLRKHGQERQSDRLVATQAGPLSDGYGPEEPADIFSEEAAATATGHSGSKTNGVESKRENLFSEATVELSLDSPRNDRKQEAAKSSSVSAPAPTAPASVSKPQASSLQELEEEEEDTFEINISITNPEKVGDGMNAFMAYKVSTQTTLPMFRNKSFTVRRRFSDFLGLYEKLSEKHSQNGYIVPPPPEKSLVGMTKVKVGKEDPSSAEFVERRRAALERYLQRVVCHPSLLQDPDVREFLEKDELPRAVGTQALSGAGIMKMINKATDAVSKMTIKMNEADVWFEEKLQEVESEDLQLKKLHAVVDSLVNHRKELSVNTAGFAKSVAMLGSSEDNTALSRALSQLAEVEDKMDGLHQEQASCDSFSLGELLADYIRLLASVRSSFDQRMKAWQRWQDAHSALQKKREAEAKLLWANKPDKLQQAKDEIAEWEAKVTQYERDFDAVSATVRKEVLRFEKEKARDFKKHIMKYLESLLHSQQQLIKYWEAFLPEAKAIA